MSPRTRVLAFVFLAFAIWLAGVTWSRSTRRTPAANRGETPDAGEVVVPVPAPELVDAFVRSTPNRIAEVDAAREADARRIAVVYATWSEATEHGLCNVPLAGVGRDDFADRLRDSLEACADAAGVFLPRSLGLGIRRADRSLLALDDPALDPIFQLGKPVVIEQSGPVAWFEDDGPFAGEAEPGVPWPTRAQLQMALERRAARHPETDLILVDWGHADADTLGRWLAQPRRYVVTSGPPPEGADALLRAHPDRFLFGTGLTLTPDAARRGPEGVPIADPAEAWSAALEELEALLDETTRGPILAGNAVRVLGL